MKRCPLMYFTTGDAQVPAYAPSQSRKAQCLGPDGKQGTLHTPLAGEFDLCYSAEEYVHHGISDGLQVLVLKGATIQADDLIRERIFRGHGIELGGSVFTVPVAKLAGGGIGLPQRRILNADNTRGWEVEEAYRSICDAAERYWAIKSGSDAVFMQDEADEVCAAALGVNYRIGMVEAILLGWFTTETIQAILDALVDWPTVLDFYHKKKQPGE